MGAEIKISDEDVELVARALYDHDRSFGAYEDEPADAPPDIFYSDARAVVERLSGRLLPSGGEVRTQYGVRWHAVPEQDEWDDWGFLDEAHAREEMASSPTPYTLLRRRTITLPVEPVVSDNSEVPDAD